MDTGAANARIRVAPSQARGLKHQPQRPSRIPRAVAPSQARGLKQGLQRVRPPRRRVAPSQARGLKRAQARGQLQGGPCRAFTGAWVETGSGPCWPSWRSVAPSQARGLKQTTELPKSWASRVAPSQARGLKRGRCRTPQCLRCRAFTGAWVETPRSNDSRPECMSRLHRRVG